jgi:predicted amidophosphoribosyltransferase
MGGSVLGRLVSAVRRDDPVDRPYVCRSCDASFDVIYHVCPCCGGFSVEARDPAAGLGTVPTGPETDDQYVE